MNARVVVAPELPYKDLALALERLGWRYVSGPARPPLVPGEPEFASWRIGEESLVYTCNPVVWLRVLDLSAITGAARRLALITAVPSLEYRRVAGLLRSRATESVLLGVLAAEVLDARDQLPALRALMHHSDRVVAVAAERAVFRFAGTDQ